MRSRGRVPRGLLTAATCALALTAGARLAAAPVINEIMFRPGTGFPENTALEFIELHNPDTTAVDLSGWAITTGADFTFPGGSTLAPGGFLVVAANPTALRATGVTGTVLGPWAAGKRLSNSGEKITLARPGSSSGVWTTIDAVSYADEGDWAVRTRDAFGGWAWSSGASGGGRTLERRNPRFAFDHGQNWGASTAAGGTPNRANSLLVSDIAPVISEVKHAPAVPTSRDVVAIECTLTDESRASALAATLRWRDATSATPAGFQSVPMVGDGSGHFSAAIAALPDKAIVEFYIQASDGTLTRTWPAPTTEGQLANAAYQVDNEVVAGHTPVYRLVLTAAENAAYERRAATNPYENQHFNVTLVATRGESSTIRYGASMRIRGESSRFATPKGLHIGLRSDDRWDGVGSFNLNPRYPWSQFLGMRLIRAAGLPAADVTPIEVRRNGIEAVRDPAQPVVLDGKDYGRWVRVEDINGDYANHHWPGAVDAQVYRKNGVSYWKYTEPAPANPDTEWSGWAKKNQATLNNWTDVMTFTRVWQQTAASHFTGAAAGDVHSGTWNHVPFSDAELTTLSTVADLDQWARWFAVMTILQNSEPNVSNGGDDDYAAAFVFDGTRWRLQFVPHDMDNLLGQGEESMTSAETGLYPMSEVREPRGPIIIDPPANPPGTPPGPGPLPPPGPGGPILIGPGGPMDPNDPPAPHAEGPFKPLLPLFGDKDHPGNATFRAKYHTAIRELLGSVFDAETAGNATPAFHATVDNHLTGWVPEAVRTQIKTFMTERQRHLLTLLGQPKITPTATSNATATAATTPALRINEVLVENLTAHANGTARPDVIELFNAGATAVSLAGKSLTDDPAAPAKFVFPAGTTIAGGGYLVVYADADTTAPGLHTGFSLDAEGDQVRLYDAASAGGALLDAVSFGFQVRDLSIARTGSTANTWALTTPTIGAANGSALTLGSVGAVRLNEWAGDIDYRLDHDFIELHNPGAQPVALGGVRLTDDRSIDAGRFVFPALSFLGPRGFLPLYGADFAFGFDADRDELQLIAENGTTIDVVTSFAQATDQSTGRAPDGGAAWQAFAIPTPGLSNQTALPATHRALLDNLRLTELMYDPAAATNAGSYEFIELQNIGTASLDLAGVRFTNGLDYTFPAGTTLAGGAFIVVAKDRAAFATRYPNAVARLAPGQFTGALDNNGETIALTLPEPWRVHILRFRYETDWQPLASGEGYSLTARTPATTAPHDWAKRSTWRASSVVNGTPGADDSGSIALALAQRNVVTSNVGAATTLSVRTSAGATVTYQWQRLVDGRWVNISGATATSYTITSTQPYDAGSYRVIVSAGGSVIASDTMTMSVGSAGITPTLRLANLSSRALVQPGANAAIPGFVITGSGNKRVLLRAIGPTLAAFGLGNTLSDPRVQLKRWNPTTSAYVDVVANDDWTSAANSAAIISTTASVGGFALGAASRDAAILTDLAPGQYAAVTSGANDASGLALVEVYDADIASAPTRLANVATRAFVGAGENVLAAGFVIVGEGSKTLLVRAVGPTLGTFGVSGTLADPQLAIYRGTESILANDDWGANPTATNTAAFAAQVGAFALPAASKDAAFVVTLPAGAYSVLVNGAAGSTGVALVEVYELP